jgi:Glycosyltransferase family 87
MRCRRAITFEIGIAFCAAALMLVAALYWSAKEPSVEKRDFSVTYLGARMVHLGLGPKVYDISEQRKLKATLLPNSEPLIFEHPPFEALLLSPLAALPYRTAYLVWGAVNIVIWLVLPWLLHPYAPVPRERLAYFALWFLFMPLGVTLFQGQSSLLVLLLFSLAFISFKRGEEFRAGIALGLALFKFQFVIPMVLIFLFLGKWKVIRGFLGMASVLGILSFVAVGWAGLANYVHLLTAIASQPDNSSFGAAVDMATVQGFVHAVLGRVLNHVTVSLIVSLISGLLIVSTAWQWKRATHSGLDKADDVMFGAAIIVSLVTGLHMFTHDLSPLILAMLVVLPNVVESRGTLPRVLTGCLILLWIPPLYFALLASHHIYLLFPLLLFLKVGLMKIVVLPQRTSFPLTGVRHLREAT